MRDIASIRIDRDKQGTVRKAHKGVVYAAPREVIPRYKECEKPYVLTLRVSIDYFNQRVTITAEGGRHPYEYSIGGVYWQPENDLALPDYGTHVAYVRDSLGVIASLSFQVDDISSYGFGIFGITTYGGPLADFEGYFVIEDLGTHYRITAMNGAQIVDEGTHYTLSNFDHRAFVEHESHYELRNPNL
jgi:hypothetical protein